MKKIGVLIEAHYDETEYEKFNEEFTKDGYELEYLSYLWGQPSLTFKGNDFTSEVVVNSCVSKAELMDYVGIILIGGYAMDRLRYQVDIDSMASNQAPAVQFLRKAIQHMDSGRLKIGAICHSLWLFCADPSLIKGRHVTCAHNIICDVENAGGIVEYEGSQTKELVISDGLITAKHPGVTDLFIHAFISELKVNT